MSDVIAGVRVNGEMLVYIDYDKPVWQNANHEGLNSTPSLSNFMVDGILGSASDEILSKYEISQRFSEEDFWGEGEDVAKVRESIYVATNLIIEYLYYGNTDPLIIGDLTKFASAFTLSKVDEKTFYELIKPQY